jgi:hypothetical protein
MPRMRLVRANSPIMIEQDVSPSDAIAAPPGTTIINSDHYDAMVDAMGSEEDLHAAMGVTTMDYNTMPLDQLKRFWKKRCKAQAFSAFQDKYANFKFLKAINAGIQSKTATKYVNFDAVLTAYDTALDSVLASIDACTTNEQVIAISFVAPA